jgi:hypothetical protein
LVIFLLYRSTEQRIGKHDDMSESDPCQESHRTDIGKILEVERALAAPAERLVPLGFCTIEGPI